MSERLKLRGEGLEWREIEGEIVVLDAESSTYFGVSKTGAALWPNLLEGATREELLAQILERFEVDHATAERDLDEFLGSLEAKNLVERGA